MNHYRPLITSAVSCSLRVCIVRISSLFDNWIDPRTGQKHMTSQHLAHGNIVVTSYYMHCNAARFFFCFRCFTTKELIKHKSGPQWACLSITCVLLLFQCFLVSQQSHICILSRWLQHIGRQWFCLQQPWTSVVNMGLSFVSAIYKCPRHASSNSEQFNIFFMSTHTFLNFTQIVMKVRCVSHDF